MEERIPANQLLNELNQRVIPALERERDIAFKERVLLGLKPDETNIRGGLWSYPKAMTKSRAYLTAIDSVGGELFKDARVDFRRLQKVSKASLEEYRNFSERVDKGFLLGRIIPKNAIRLKRLRDTFQSVQKALDGARKRYEMRLAPLRSGEKREQIRALSENLVGADFELQKRRLEIDAKYSQIQKGLRVSKALSLSLVKFGTEEVSVSRDLSPLGTVALPKIKMQEIKTAAPVVLKHKRLQH